MTRLEELRRLMDEEHTCGFDRNGSHSANAYVEYDCALCDALTDDTIAALLDVAEIAWEQVRWHSAMGKDVEESRMYAALAPLVKEASDD